MVTFVNVLRHLLSFYVLVTKFTNKRILLLILKFKTLCQSLMLHTNSRGFLRHFQIKLNDF